MKARDSSGRVGGVRDTGLLVNQRESAASGFDRQGPVPLRLIQGVAGSNPVSPIQGPFRETLRETVWSVQKEVAPEASQERFLTFEGSMLLSQKRPVAVGADRDHRRPGAERNCARVSADLVHKQPHAEGLARLLNDCEVT